MAKRKRKKKSTEELGTENELMKLKMMAEFGGNFVGSDDIPADVENQFLKQIISFHKQHESSGLTTVYKFIGEPEYNHVNDMSDKELAEVMRTTSVFARIRPQQKLRLVEALKQDGEIVAMTGDGVNDAPAMKAAHIGISMGSRGTDVAREASSLVLLNDDFASIVATIRLGRRIYDNLRKAIQYIIAVHIPIAGLALIPLLFGMPLMLFPIQIALLEMVIDPACSVVFEAEGEERDVMQRPPRSPNTPVLPRNAVLWAALQGLAALAIAAATLYWGSTFKMPQDTLRAMVFTVLVLMNIGLILVNRSFRPSLREALLRPNRTLWLLVSGVLLILAAALYWPPAQELFHFGPMHSRELAGCLAGGIALVAALECAKSLGFIKE